MSRVMALIVAAIVFALSFIGLIDLGSLFPGLEEGITDFFSAPSESEYEEPEMDDDSIFPYDHDEEYSEEDNNISFPFTDLIPVTFNEEDSDYIVTDEYPGEYENSVLFGSLYMSIPEEYILETTLYDDHNTISGTNEENGGEFYMCSVPLYNQAAASVLENLSKKLDADVQEINGVLCIITGDEENEADLCICEDQTVNTLYVIGFDRPEGEKIGPGFFETIGRVYPQE